jgi:hypothetical protein
MAAAAPSAPAASGAQPDAGTMLKFCTLEVGRRVPGGDKLFSTKELFP